MQTDGDDFAAFAAAEFPRLLRFGHLLSGDRTAAEDLVQTALARTHLHWPQLRDRGAAPAYVRQAMVRQQANRWNRLLSRERTVAHVPERVDPASAYDGVDDRDAMWAALARLAPRQRAVLVLRYYEQLSEAEIAGVLGCSTGTVKSQASKGLARLRVQLTPERTEVAP
ncbi:MAG: SigE family RNA polymerase sigma factor [Actinobacteria bacterium]|nr:SigE family RNA polymerase sigma factor [Actinomycetota bacterium]MCA1722322.1 SigE family RNA polymerase sigma factor [Actinomycetota bacterium]